MSVPSSGGSKTAAGCAATPPAGSPSRPDPSLVRGRCLPGWPPAGHQARVNTTRSEPAEGTPLVYQCALPLSRQTLTFTAGLLRAHLKKIRSRWRKLPPGKIALIVLATLRHDHRLADMASGNSVSASTID